ncbi:MAG: hypothetical protein Q9191_007204 [Dirinaria sp. TL-2023a]
MAQKSFRKSQLIEFKNTAAGHDGVLSDPSGSLIIKPCKPAEIRFYESCAAHEEFAEYIPTFMGTLSLSSDTDPAQAAAALMQSKEAQVQVQGPSGVSEAIVVDNVWTPSNGGKISTNCALVMENVADGYKKPNILDVKLGARLWADDAPPAKRAKLDKVAGETTSKPLGFRIAGMRIWKGLDSAGQDGVNADGYHFYDKDYGRALKADNVVEGFEDYFRMARGAKPTRRLTKVIKRFIEDLQELQTVLEKEESRMYSASLLFVYEGDSSALQEAFRRESQMLDSMEAETDLPLEGDSGPKSDEVAINQVTSKSSGGTGVPPSVNGDGHVAHDVKPESIAADKAAEHQPITAAVPANGDDAEGEVALPRTQALKLIDFAHAEWTPGQGRDENLLHGIRNVIDTLGGLLM